MPKEIKKVRGTARIYDDDSLDFTPQKEGNPVQKDVKKVRKSTFYTTNGEKASSYVMHLNVDASDIDPVATLTEDFDKLVKNIDNKATKPLAGKKILDNGATVVYVNKKQHALQIGINVDLEKEPLYKNFIFNQIYDIQKCFITNSQLIAGAFPAQRNSFTKLSEPLV